MLSTVSYASLEKHPGYRVGNDGSVWSQWTRVGVNTKVGERARLGDKWHRLKPNRLKKGYLLVTLFHNGVKSYRLVHQLVLEAFVGPRPAGCVGRHLDGNTSNNNLTNLCWSTQSVNLADRKIHGTEIIGSRNGRAKLTEADVRRIYRRYKAGGKSQEAIAREYGVGQARVSAIVHRQTWKHLDLEACEK